MSCEKELFDTIRGVIEHHGSNAIFVCRVVENGKPESKSEYRSIRWSGGGDETSDRAVKQFREQRAEGTAFPVGVAILATEHIKRLITLSPDDPAAEVWQDVFSLAYDVGFRRGYTLGSNY
jgi:hypothetical protein